MPKEVAKVTGPEEMMAVLRQQPGLCFYEKRKLLAPDLNPDRLVYLVGEANLEKGLDLVTDLCRYLFKTPIGDAFETDDEASQWQQQMHETYGGLFGEVYNTGNQLSADSVSLAKLTVSDLKDLVVKQSLNGGDDLKPAAHLFENIVCWLDQKIRGLDPDTGIGVETQFWQLEPGQKLETVRFIEDRIIDVLDLLFTEPSQ